MAKGPTLVQVRRPELPASCDSEQRLFFARGNQTILPQRLPRLPERHDPLRQGAPRELAETTGERRVIQMPGGALVALDNGEFGAGLYWLGDSAKEAVALDAHLLHRIRWIGKTRTTVVAVSGLCHGEACHERSRSIVYEVSRAEYAETAGGGQAWRVEPLHVVRGCPEVITIDQANDALLLATCHGLHRLDELGNTLVASWPSFLSAIDVADVTGPEHRSYYVSFGQLIASFAPDREAWFTTPQCVRR
jgi:hypothetical protein